MRATTVPVRLAEGTESGFADIMGQFLRQNLDESERKRRSASRLRGRLAMTAADRGYSITLVFAEEGVTIYDGENGPVDASIVGPYERLIGLAQGKSNQLIEHLRGRLKVTSRWRRPFLPLRVHGLIKLDEEQGTNEPAGVWAGIATIAALAGASAGLFVVLWLVLAEV